MSTIEELQIGYSLGYLGSGYLEGVHLDIHIIPSFLFSCCVQVYLFIFILHTLHAVGRRLHCVVLLAFSWSTWVLPTLSGSHYPGFAVLRPMAAFVTPPWPRARYHSHRLASFEPLAHKIQ